MLHIHLSATINTFDAHPVVLRNESMMLLHCQLTFIAREEPASRRTARAAEARAFNGPRSDPRRDRGLAGQGKHRGNRRDATRQSSTRSGDRVTYNDKIIVSDFSISA